MIYTLVRKKNNVVDAIISFDSISSSEESWSATVTTQTVEKGFDISDNINIEPASYSIDAVISSYSLFNLNNEIIWDGSGFKSSAKDNKDFHIKARDELIKIFKDRSVLTLVESTINSNDDDLTSKYEGLKKGHFKEVESCVITSLSISHPDSGTGAFYVSLKIQSVNIATVNVEVITATPLVRPLLIDIKKEASKAKNADGSEVASDTGTGDDTLIPEPLPKVGRTQAEFEKFRAATTRPLRYTTAAWEKAREVAAATNVNQIVKGDPSGYSVVPVHTVR